MGGVWLLAALAAVSGSVLGRARARLGAFLAPHAGGQLVVRDRQLRWRIPLARRVPRGVLGIRICPERSVLVRVFGVPGFELHALRPGVPRATESRLADEHRRHPSVASDRVALPFTVSNLSLQQPSAANGAGSDRRPRRSHPRYSGDGAGEPLGLRGFSVAVAATSRTEGGLGGSRSLRSPSQ